MSRVTRPRQRHRDSSVSDITHDVVDDGFHEIHLSGSSSSSCSWRRWSFRWSSSSSGCSSAGRPRSSRPRPDHLADPTAALAASPGRPRPPRRPRTPDPRRRSHRSPPGVRRAQLQEAAGGDASAERLKPARPRQQPARRRRTPAPSASGARALRARLRRRHGDQARRRLSPARGSIRGRAARSNVPPPGSSAPRRQRAIPAFLVAAGPPTGTYKVQIGRYKDRDEAMRVIDRLKKENSSTPGLRASRPLGRPPGAQLPRNSGIRPAPGLR